MSEFANRPVPIRLINAAGRGLARFGRQVPELSAAALLAAAEKRTGLNDFGDSRFQPALEELLRSLHEESRLTLIGRIMVREFCTGILVNRLLLAEALKQQPQIVEQPLPRPIFVVGLPRTGTTLLHRLLAQDPWSRFLYTWETFRIDAPPEPGTLESDPRIEEVGRRMKFVDYLAPEMQLKHPVGPRLPEECIALMSHTFVSPLMFSVMAHVPGYTRWLDGQDMAPTYRYFKRLLQFLQYRFPPVHWVLKSPGHLLQPDALLEVFPDACIVQTHRHPMKVVPSWCSLVATMHAMTSDDVDPFVLGEHWSGRWARMVEQTLAVRSRVGPKQFFDVNYHELIQDPLGTVRQIYDYFDYRIGPEMEQRIAGWKQRNRQHKHGVHRYSAEQFGLRPGQIEEQFAAYLQAHPQPMV